MKIVFGKLKWEMWQPSLADILNRAVQDGFEATEIHLKYLPEDSETVAAQIRQYGMRLIAEVITAADVWELNVFIKYYLKTNLDT